MVPLRHAFCEKRLSFLQPRYVILNEVKHLVIAAERL